MSALINIYNIQDAEASLGGVRGCRNGGISLKTSSGTVELCTYGHRDADRALAALQEIADHITMAVDQLRADVEAEDLGKLVEDIPASEVADDLAQDVRRMDADPARAEEIRNRSDD